MKKDFNQNKDVVENDVLGSLLGKTKEVILDILFPPLCLNCQKHLKTRMATNINTNGHEYQKWLCDDCYSLIKFNNTLFCPVCRARLADNKRICQHCYYYDDDHNNDKKKRSFYYLLGAAGNYDDPALQNLIHYFKYKSFKNLAPVLGEILIKYLESLSLLMVNSQKSIVMPIPLHPRRERQRGFNQAKLIAEIVAKKFNWDLSEGLKRIKNNKPQVGLRDSEARIKNMGGCFEIQDPGRVKDKNILLVDDVFTSGATMNEAVRILKANGAKRIIALVIAKA
jgi:ComF family protein